MPSPTNQVGYRFATLDEIRFKSPSCGQFLRSDLSIKCASAYFDPIFRHCDFRDCVLGIVSSEPFGITKRGLTDGNAESWYVREACRVAGLTPITDAMAQAFEAANGNIVDTEHLDAELQAAVATFRQSVLAQVGRTFTITSGFRPTAYQAHLHELRERFRELDAIDGISATITNRRPQLLVDDGVAAATACQDLVDQVNAEIRRHLLVPDVVGAPKVAPAGKSRHEIGQGVDIAIAGATNAVIDQLAAQAGLHRPYGAGDRVHFERIGAGSPTGELDATIIGRSPINLLLEDPQGRRLGFDPVTQQVVNDFGPFAEYSGPGSEPQILLLPLGAVAQGFYTVTGVGTGDGPYRVTVQTAGDHNPLLPETTVASGTAASGQPIAAVERLGLVLRTQLATAQFGAALADLEALVADARAAGGIDSAGIANSLTQKVRGAQRKVEGDDLCIAAEKLQAFTSEVQAQRGKHIAAGSADNLVAYSSVLHDALTAGCP
jgi:hypothetical protein